MSDFNKMLENYKGKGDHIDYDWERIEPLMKSMEYSDMDWSQKMKKFDNDLFTTPGEIMQYELEKQSDLGISTFNDDVSSELILLGNSVNSKRKELSTKKNARVKRLHKRKHDFFTQMCPGYKAMKENGKRERGKILENLREEKNGLLKEKKGLQTEILRYENLIGEDMKSVSSLPYFAEQNFKDQDVRQPQQAGLPSCLQAPDYQNSFNHSFPYMGMN